MTETWTQTADMEEGDLTDFDAVTPAWDGEVNEVADFDSVSDADGDLNDAAAAAHDGATGLEITFDNATVAYGTRNASAINQKSGVLSFWFDPNSFSLEDNKQVHIANCRDGVNNLVAAVAVKISAGQWQAQFGLREDGPVMQWQGWQNIDDVYQNIKLMFVMSSAPGANDGVGYFYTDDTLIDSVTGFDNNGQDWDYARFGMIYTTSTTFGGSFYLDTIKIDPVGAPMADKLAAQNGSYGMSIPIMDATTRYVTFTGPANEGAITFECTLDPNTLTMTTGDEFRLVYGIMDVAVNGQWGTFTLNLEDVAGAYKIFAEYITDAGAIVAMTSISITDAPHDIRLTFKASSSVGTDDGYIKLYIDDVLEASATGLDTDQRLTDAIRLGAYTGIDAGTYGIIHFDDCKWAGEVFSDLQIKTTGGVSLGSVVAGDAVALFSDGDNWYAFNLPKQT